MRYRSIPFVILAAATLVPFAANMEISAQSVPVGEVSTRISSKQPVGVGARYSPFTPGLHTTEEFSLLLANSANWNSRLQSDQHSRNNAKGTASKTAWDFLLREGQKIKPDDSVEVLRNVIEQITDPMTPGQAVQLAAEACGDANLKIGCKKWAVSNDGTLTRKSVPSGQETILDRLIDNLKGIRCSTTVTSGDAGSNDITSYDYRIIFPTFGGTCTTESIQNFFSVSKSLTPASKVQYLYNPQQSTSQVSAQLLTATFPGFQAVLSGTATAGTSQPSNSGLGTGAGRDSGADSAGSGSSTESVDTAVSKIEAGGDFNIGFPVPVFNYSKGEFGIYGFTAPNIGFTISGFSGQNTITESSEYTLNTPFEVFAQLYSIDKDSNGIPNATIFLDLKPGMDAISQAMADKIGLTGSREFFLGQGALGIEFANSIRLSFQYIAGPKQIYQTVDSSGAATTTSNKIGGFHLAVSFSPQKSKNKTSPN